MCVHARTGGTFCHFLGSLTRGLVLFRPILKMAALNIQPTNAPLFLLCASRTFALLVLSYGM
jgi:hypothetical protein